MNDIDALLILNAIPQIGNATIDKLLDAYGSPQAVIKLSESQLKSDGILNTEQLSSFLAFKQDEFLKQECEFIAQEKVKVLIKSDENYPLNLKEIKDAPNVLYCKGEIPKDIGLSIGMVGSRTASVYGITTAEKIAAELAEMGITIVSGMARGIDTAAHRGALKVKGTTVAVLGCGLNHIYPPENDKIMKEISKNGVVISEFSMSAEPLPFNFPRRNRIISGLSLGVVVVEAAQRSGALITADCALEQGREVYAVPGKIDSPTSTGVNRLIKQGAKLITSVDDILEDLSEQLKEYLSEKKTIDASAEPQEPENINNNLTPQENLVYSIITIKPIHIDEIIEKVKESSSLVSTALLRLELKKLIKQLPGKLYVR